MDDNERRIGGGDDLDALLDDVLHDMTRSADVDVRNRVLTAIAEVEDEGRRPTEVRTRGWFPAIAFGGALVLVLAAVLVLTRGSGRVFPPGSGEQPRATTNGTAPTPAREELGGRPTPEGLLRTAPRHVPLAEGPRRAAASRSHARRLLAADSVPPELVDESALSSEPYLPGAPAGELGDPIAPLPAPPAIRMAPIAQAPIQSAPRISDIARPVTDFTDATQSPESSGSTTSGGNRR